MAPSPGGWHRFCSLRCVRAAAMTATAHSRPRAPALLVRRWRPEPQTPPQAPRASGHAGADQPTVASQTRKREAMQTIAPLLGLSLVVAALSLALSPLPGAVASTATVTIQRHDTYQIIDGFGAAQPGGDPHQIPVQD